MFNILCCVDSATNEEELEQLINSLQIVESTVLSLHDALKKDVSQLNNISGYFTYG